MSSCLSVLRIGPTTADNVAATMLRTALVEHFSQNETQSSSSSSSSAALKNGQVQISNRYFTADLLLRNVDDDDNNDDTTLATTTTTTTTSPSSGDDSCQDDDDRPRKQDGVILVFDNNATTTKTNPDHLPSNNNMSRMTAATSFDSLDAVHNRIEATTGDLLRLCVGVVVSSGETTTTTNVVLRSGKEYETEYRRRILWCLDRGYEYVDMTDLSEAGRQSGHDSRDKEGFARIVEAINGTVWSSAVMKQVKRQELKQSYHQTTEITATAQQEEQGPNEHDEEEEEESNPYIPPDPSLLSSSLAAVAADSDQAREEKARQALLLGQSTVGVPPENGEEEAYYSYLPTSSTGEENVNPEIKAQRQQQLRQEREQEQLFQNLEGALRQAASIREMSQSGNLTDDDRRQRAGDAAELLMSLMGQMGMDDDEDGDDDSSDNEENESGEREPETEQVETG